MESLRLFVCFYNTKNLNPNRRRAINVIRYFLENGDPKKDLRLPFFGSFFDFVELRPLKRSSVGQAKNEQINIWRSKSIEQNTKHGNKTKIISASSPKANEQLFLITLT
jgi:hypothetical protein